jgi:hypothetical protein
LLTGRVSIKDFGKTAKLGQNALGALLGQDSARGIAKNCTSTKAGQVRYLTNLMTSGPSENGDSNRNFLEGTQQSFSQSSDQKMQVV